MTGTVTDLRSGGFGFLASDSYRRPWALIFRRHAVVDGDFDRLRVGQRVCFVQEAQPGDSSRSHAIHVAPLD